MDSSKTARSPPPYSPQFQNIMNPITSAPPTQMIYSAPPPYPGNLPMNIDYFKMSPHPQTRIPEAQNNMNSIVNTNQSQSSEICPMCRDEVKMNVEYHATGMTYAISGLICIAMLWPFVCLPCIFKVGYKLGKFCPNCYFRVGNV